MDGVVGQIHADTLENDQGRILAGERREIVFGRIGLEGDRDSPEGFGESDAGR